MRHGVAGDETPLRGEVRAILATMRTRLEAPSLKSHMIIPVSTCYVLLTIFSLFRLSSRLIYLYSQAMVFSFMGKQHGRILQAHFRWEEARHPEITALRLYDQGGSSGSNSAILTVHGE